MPSGEMFAGSSVNFSVEGSTLEELESGVRARIAQLIGTRDMGISVQTAKIRPAIEAHGSDVTVWQADVELTVK